MRCNDVVGAIELEGLSPLPETAREHLAGCTACQSFVADLNSIVSAAHELPAEVEPPARIWISLRAQLVAEGLIHEGTRAIAPAPRGHWWEGFSGLLQGRALATAAVGLLIFAGGVVQLRNSAPVTPSEPAAKVQVQEPDALAASGTALTNQEHELRAAQPAGTLASSPVDDSLQKDLQTLDAFIAECEHHLKANPHDQLAREYLAGAYQQKAELLAEMMDRGRSVN
jgi:ribosomal protein S15P/S13E